MHWAKNFLCMLLESANPRCFKHIKSLPCKYTNQAKSWMDSDIFTRWLKELDRKMIAEGRKIKELPKISILDAMKFLVQAWNRVSKDTIQNCFKRAGISKDAQTDAVEEIDDPFKSLQSDLDELQLLDLSLAPDDTTAEDYTDTDKNLVVTESVLIDDEEILGQYRETLNIDVDDDTQENAEEVEPLKKPSRSEIYAAMELLQKCSLFEEEEVAFKMRRHLEKFNLICGETQEMKKQQTTIENFFDRL